MHESCKKWVNDGEPKLICQCGCGQEIIVKKHWSFTGIPEYILGHARRLKFNESYKKWVEDGKPKVFCKCGCGQEIIIKKHHRWYGIPKYIHGHENKGKNNPLFGKHHSEETKQKMSELKKGKHLSEEHKKNIRDAQQGENHPFFGKHHSEETKQKMSELKKGKYYGENNPNFGKKHSKEVIEKMSKENNPNWKGGISFGKYCSKFNGKKKEEVREQYNRKCYFCGKSEEEQINEMKEQGKRLFRLSVHHLDEDKEQGCNGKSWKLVPLCIHCHAKSHKKLVKL